MTWPTQRKRSQKHIEAHDIDDAVLHETLNCLVTMNRRAQGVSSILAHFKAWSVNWPKDQPVRIVDLCCGSADIPLEIAKWATEAGFDVRIVAADSHPKVLAFARQHLAGNDAGVKIQLMQANLFDLPFEANSFDYCICSMALHQLPDISLLTALRIMERLAKRGMVWSDMLRGFRPRMCVRLAMLGRPSAVRDDAMAAVDAGFSRAEVIEIARRLELGVLSFRQHFIYRFTLAGEWKAAWTLPLNS